MRHDIISKTDFRTIYDGTADEEALVRKILPEVPWVEFILKSMNMWRDKIKEREIYKEKRGILLFIWNGESALNKRREEGERNQYTVKGSFSEVM